MTQISSILTSPVFDERLALIIKECDRWEKTAKYLEAYVIKVAELIVPIVPDFKVSKALLTENMSLYIYSNQKDFPHPEYENISSKLRPLIFAVEHVGFQGDSLHICSSSGRGGIDVGVVFSFNNPDPHIIFNKIKFTY